MLAPLSEVGLAISNTVIGGPFLPLTAGFVVAYVPFFASGPSAKGSVVAEITIAGLIVSFGTMGSLALKLPIIVLCSSPRRGNTTDRRAVCGEIRMHGSEGGAVQTNAPSLPLSVLPKSAVFFQSGRNDDQGHRKITTHSFR